MPASEAQIAANRANSLKSTGPKTPEGKEASRANSYKHGLTATTVFPEREAAEVQRRYEAYCRELAPSGEVGYALVMRAATLATRMERCVEYETAVLTQRVRLAEAEFVPPPGVDAAEEFRLRKAAGRLALFDPSQEATLARRYEMAAERGFFRALKELRQHERAAQAPEVEMFREELASSSPRGMTDEEFEAMEAREAAPAPRPQSGRVESVDFAALRGRVDVPFTIGKRR